MAPNLVLTNCKLLGAPQASNLCSIVVENGRISERRAKAISNQHQNVLDLEGRLLAPGLIDVHIQGAGGADVLDGSKEALKAIAQTNARFGVTSFLATTVFRPEESNGHLDVAAENVGKDLEGASLLGIHIEGPFIAMKKKGMILPECICAPSLETWKQIWDLTQGTLKMMTIAPELPGALGIVEELIRVGVVASFGHSMANLEETQKGFQAGISHVTHLFNAMPSLHHREPGPLPAIFDTPQVTAQIIPDGVHLHPRILRFAFELLGKSRAVAITDGMQAIGLPDGQYVYNGMEYQAKGGTARYHDGTLIGTCLGLSQLVKRLSESTGCTLADAVQTATLNPAKVLGLADRKGRIREGYDADLMVLDSDSSVWATVVGGRVVYQKK